MAESTTYNWTAEDAALQGRVDSLKKVDETDNAFAKRCGLDPGNFGKFRLHKLSLGVTYLRRISTACQVSYKWLKDGIGERDDQEGMVSEPLPDRNRIYTDPSRDGKRDKDANVGDAITIELLKAENNALYAVLQNVTQTMDILTKTLEQNNKILTQNADALSQNRALMQFISDILNKK